MSVRYVDHDEINRAHFYWAAIPFSDGRPLDFFVKGSTCPNGCSQQKPNCGQAIATLDGFDQTRGMTMEVIVPHKQRLAVVFQIDRLNHNKDYEHVYVAPVRSLHDASDELKERLMKQNDIPQMHFLGQVTGRNSFIHLADLKRIHKSLLLEYRSDLTPLGDNVMSEMCKKIATILKIEEIAECENCQRPCKNCQLKKEAVNK